MLGLAVFGGGCGSWTNSSVEEEKEAHYLAGKNCLQSRDFQGALKAFEKSLLVIPSSASAHFQLGSLHANNFKNPAQAIYHYEKMLSLREDHYMAEQVKEFIRACKVKIASEVALLPGDPRPAEETAKLIREKEALTNQVAQLLGQISKLKLSLSRAMAHSGAANSGRNTAAASPELPAPPAGNRKVQPAMNTQTPDSPARREKPRFIKYVLREGDNFYSLGKKYRTSTAAIQRANPQMHPLRLRPGAVVNIPFSPTMTASAR